MPSMNHTILLGGLTQDPELRQTAGGTAICKFGLAVTEEYKDKSGQMQKSTLYIDVDAWGRLGELVAQYLRKGSAAVVEGRLQLDQWTAKDGSKRSKISLRAQDVQFLDRISGAAGAAPASKGDHGGPPTGGEDEDDDIVPF
jgi:single-strand DNA-binding protein